MKYLYNPSNKMAIPFSQKIYERRRDLVVLDKSQLDRVLRGEDIQSVLHGGAPAATKKTMQPQLWRITSFVGKSIVSSFRLCVAILSIKTSMAA